MTADSVMHPVLLGEADLLDKECMAARMRAGRGACAPVVTPCRWSQAIDRAKDTITGGVPKEAGGLDVDGVSALQNE